MEEGPTPEELTRVVLRPIASPLPLGLFAFSTGNALLAALQLHLIPAGESRVLGIAMLAIMAPLDLLACIMSFHARDAEATSLLGIFGSLWAVTGVSYLTVGAAATTATMGIVYAMLALSLLVAAFLSISGKPLFAVILFTAVARLGFLSAKELGARPWVDVVSAIIGLALVLLGLYTAAALLAEEVKRREVLPVFRRGKSKESFEGDLGAQIDQIPHAPGVRDRL